MFRTALFTILSVATWIASVDCKSVFAHVVVGNTYSYTQSIWASDISAAQAAGIDGFALNIAYQDTINSNGNVQTQLNNAYAAADSAGFKLFFSFDYAAQGAWDPSTVISTINNYKSHSSQFLYGNNQPLASTFEGPGNAGDWASIKSQTGCFFMPDYSSQGPQGAAAEPNIDGLLSWDAWPVGAMDISDQPDMEYVSALNGKPYMMPVSPWFYTNLPSKNWLWRGDDMWHDRWQQVVAINPELVEIITWNDFGESHYVGPLPPNDSAFPTGSEVYAANIPHNAWLNDLPYYIAQYKGESLPDESHVTLWYRLNPGQACSADGTLCNTATQDQDTTEAYLCDTDYIFFTAFVPSDATATVTIQIGSNAPTTVTAPSAGIFHSSVPFNGQTGTVLISATGSDGTKINQVTCPDITTDCTDGNVNWNAWVGGG